MKFDINKIAPEAMLVLMSKQFGYPVGLSVAEKAIELHPELFPEEAEHARKWKLVPKEVQEAELDEMMELHTQWREWYQEHYPESSGKGMMYYIDHPEEWNASRESWAEGQKEFQWDQKEKDIYDKWFNKYGLTK